VSGKAEAENAKEVETELRTLVRSLQQEVENKNHDLQVMQKSLERLRKEKHMSYTNDLGRFYKFLFIMLPEKFQGGI
jgi:uncharacterized protein YlxW (UPF0749 family)